MPLVGQQRIILPAKPVPPIAYDRLDPAAGAASDGVFRRVPDCAPGRAALHPLFGFAVALALTGAILALWLAIGGAGL